MKHRKLLAVLICLALCLALAAGCGKNTDGQTQTTKQTETTAQTELSASNDALVLHQLVSQLPEELRTVVEFRLNQDLPFREIAERCGVPLGTALWRMHRAIEVLREQWK